jgi:hypothetical protein
VHSATAYSGGRSLLKADAKTAIQRRYNELLAEEVDLSTPPSLVEYYLKLLAEQASP